MKTTGITTTSTVWLEDHSYNFGVVNCRTLSWMSCGWRSKRWSYTAVFTSTSTTYQRDQWGASHHRTHQHCQNQVRAVFSMRVHKRTYHVYDHKKELPCPYPKLHCFFPRCVIILFKCKDKLHWFDLRSLLSRKFFHMNENLQINSTFFIWACVDELSRWTQFCKMVVSYVL